MGIKSFNPETSTVTAGAIGSIPIVPSDEYDLEYEVRAITVSGSGRIAWHDYDDNYWITGVLPAGTYPMFVKRVLVSGTTATGMAGWV